ncbi:hypothetical protein GCM10027275_50430 [Rhabdobacter roseus]|uniref:Uncharacterized protein n=1 Tax=Rhabdobacter roseus TaxID=1655419 RepID=A0A840TRY8_9BACT|nr:hypothetical protein [Rhabdobacter roseus]MBB5287116.1 hypothetical protein [Rhabdobacter roseus]
MEASLEDNIVSAREVFSRLDARGERWKRRNVPIFIRERLWVPYYITEENGERKLYVIHPPDRRDPRVHFLEVTCI